MGFFRRIDAFLGHLPGRRAVVLACAAFVFVGVSVVAGGFALAPGEDQRLVYTSDDGEVISLNPRSGE
jgi:hypothetical protein